MEKPNFLKPPEIVGIATLNEKGQFVIPKEARERLGINSGDRLVVAFAPFADALVIVKPDDLEKHLNNSLKNTKQAIVDAQKTLKKKLK